MNLTFYNPGLDAMIQSIMEFQTKDETAFWSDSLYYFYPQLDKEYARGITFDRRKEYIGKALREQYVHLESEINQKKELYAAHWAKNKKQIEAALSEAFEIDCSLLFNEMRCDISMNPVSPRFLEEERFEVFYLNSERGAIGVAIHEIIHIVWFYVWNELFRDCYEEYERPSMKWILSEMVVESIMKDPRLSTINPYFPRESGGCIYPYFFDMRIGGKPVLETIDEMYREHDIRAFMKNSFAFCMANEKEIRRHIETSEQGKQ